LSIAPETSFFKRTYKRVSNYAIEAIDQPLTNPQWGGHPVVHISRNGDLIGEMYMVLNVRRAQLTAPGADTVHWTNSLGHAALKSASFSIGNNEIDKIPGEFLEVRHEFESDININVDELVLRNESQAQLVDWCNNGNTLNASGVPITQLWVKLDFWFARARSQALPVIALQYHDMTVKLDLRAKTELLVYSNAANTTLNDGAELNGDIMDGCVCGHFAFLDSGERRLFAANAHEYLVKSVQVSDFHTKSASTDKVNARVTFNHPVSALFWMIQKKSHQTNLDYFNYERTDGFGDDTLLTATVKFNGSEREKPRGPLYFRTIHPSLYFNRTPRKNIYAYSFSQYPSSWFPSGSVNMSRIDTTALEFTFPTVDAEGAAFGEADVVVYAEAFNVLRIQGGEKYTEKLESSETNLVPFFPSLQHASVDQAKGRPNTPRSGNILKLLAVCRLEMIVSRTVVTPLPICC
jgi:hypothetical protein